MRLIVRQDYEEVASYVAYYVKERINQFQPTPERPFVLGLATGSSPILVYHKLVDFYAAGQVSFENVVTFNTDEYVGLPKDHPQSYHTFMWNHLFKHVNIKKENVHILDGNANNLDEECRKFEAEIAKLGGIELFLGGIGPDGHIAFNEPGSSLTSRTRVKTLAYETIIANARFFGGDISRVPKLALTVGVATVMDAREVMIVITGAHKSLALAKCVEEGVNHMWTVSAIQMHPKGLIVCDEDATLELHVKTVKYFKSIEHVHHSIIGKHNLGLQGNLLRNMVDTNQAAKRRRRLMLQSLLNDEDEKLEDEEEDEAQKAATAAVEEAGKKRKRSNSTYWEEKSALLDVNP
ncbi:glucosamine-6-phosphate isomerase 1 [Phascolomyces articulosus]|uniref:Glucosamine-6-phosphate isomerase n=1 Tax=Phascolomyces articulosus TaxID=60185 RepID=A0AAD5KV27_9FUNG|nr:glucosamine-6-phosphate isomerase 1 [Phascolomyces articulosus]